MDNTAAVKGLHIDVSAFEMPEDVKLAKLVKALSCEKVNAAEHTETVYTVGSGDSSYGIMF